jgi:hypothetical protein
VTSRSGKTRSTLEAAPWAVAVGYVAATFICVVGSAAKHASWVYTSSFVVAGAVGLGFILTAIVLSATSRGGPFPTRRLRTVTGLWWDNASTTEKWIVGAAGALAVCIAVAGIVGSAQHSDLVARSGSYFVVTDSGERKVSQDVFDGFMYARYVLGLLGPAMAVSSFLFLIYRAFMLASRRADLLALAGSDNGGS